MSKAINIFLSLKPAFKIRTALNNVSIYNIANDAFNANKFVDIFKLAKI